MTNSRPHVTLDGQYSLTEVAIILKVARTTIYRWVGCGYLKTRKHRYNKRPFVLGREILRIYDAYE